MFSQRQIAPVSAKLLCILRDFSFIDNIVEANLRAAQALRGFEFDPGGRQEKLLFFQIDSNHVGTSRTDVSVWAKC
jgi:hypothetical protein